MAITQGRGWQRQPVMAGRLLLSYGVRDAMLRLGSDAACISTADWAKVISTEKPLKDAIVVVVVPTWQATYRLTANVTIETDCAVIHVVHPRWSTRFALAYLCCLVIPSILKLCCCFTSGNHAPSSTPYANQFLLFLFYSQLRR